MSEIIVEKQIVMKKINEVKPYVRNPRKNDKTVDLLCKVIPKVGFNVPLVIDERGIIVKGHARFAAAIRLGMKEIPCVITHADEEAIKADRIADNKISEFSEWITDELMHEIDMIDIDLDFSELGIDTVSFDDIPDFEDFDAPSDMSDGDKQKLYQEFLERQAKEAAVPVEITSDKAIKSAEQKQGGVAKEPIKYYKCVCEKCGHVMFVDAKQVWSKEEGLIRVK